MYVCKKTNGFELINLGKFDFSSAGLLRAACRDFSRQQCHAVVTIAAVTGGRIEVRFLYNRLALIMCYLLDIDLALSSIHLL